MSHGSTFFTLVVAYGRSLHFKGAKPDGQAAWQPLKTEFKKVDCLSQWGSGASSMTDLASLESLKELKAIESGEVAVAGIDREMAHFAKQILLIPRTKECSFVRVMQVAYNYGQLFGILGSKTPPPRIASVIRVFKTNMDTVCDMGAFGSVDPEPVREICRAAILTFRKK
jgi:hypothetical protein